MENQKKLTPEQVLETTVQSMLHWKSQYGKEVSFSCQIQTIALQAENKARGLEEQIKVLNEKMKSLEAKPKLVKNKDDKK